MSLIRKAGKCQNTSPTFLVPASPPVVRYGSALPYRDLKFFWAASSFCFQERGRSPWFFFKSACGKAEPCLTTGGEADSKSF